MSEVSVLDALAEAAEAAAAVLRRRAALLRPGEPGGEPPSGVADRARLVHPMLGPRQAEVLAELETAGRAGTTTGAIARALDNDQANTHITLGALVKHGLADKDASVYPHVYRLSPLLLSPPEGGGTSE